ncbi:MAG: radical SAM protein, partial [Acidobacteriales bacterium]|nr:radical SAM protein [Terriglobales bacterium]
MYDTQYWAEWSQPYGLLRMAALLKKHKYRKLWLFDFMETDEDRKVRSHRIQPNEDYSERNWPEGQVKPIEIAKAQERLTLYKRHYGKTWDEFEEYIRRRGLHRNPPSEVWVTSIMSYWWESTRDLTFRVKRLFGKRTKIVLGGIYPSLAPQHALDGTAADVVVAGEVLEANDLWTDLSLYREKPSYAIITPSRGCPYDCSYCAQKAVNGGVSKVRYRPPSDVFAEMRSKHEKYGIRDFAFYADFLLLNYKTNFIPLLQQIVESKLPFRLYAPEGLDTRFLSSSQELVDLMKAAHFQKVYL